MYYKILDDFTIEERVPLKLFDKYKDKLPEQIIQIWEEYGFGSFMNGFLRTINPLQYQDLLPRAYFMGDKCIPIFLTALGDMIVWEENTYQIMMSNMQVDADHAKLHKILSSANIPYVILKGNVSASYYPDPMLRAMGDVDFLIEKHNVGKVDLLLRKNGFEAQQSNHECERAYHKGISIWELHWEVNGVPGGEAG